MHTIFANLCLTFREDLCAEIQMGITNLFVFLQQIQHHIKFNFAKKFMTFFMYVHLQNWLLKISLYDRVFSNPKFATLLKKNTSFAQFLTGYISDKGKDHLHFGGPTNYILGAYNFFESW